ncbi:MAG: hemolysin family protein [Defluviitaleaceae bacterium]|nr:hemolysin family protein [Defluviitaleaceae bacterium]MCL2240802.1 hemolysin family protein [Defluviitaleaceae bacterium]
MVPDIIFYLIVLLSLFVLGSFFSAAEMAFSALSRPRVKTLSETGSKRATLVLNLHERFDELISTLLICNNIVAITAATVGVVFFVRLIGEENGPWISAVIITAIVVVLTDIFPKSVAKESPERVAMVVAPFLRVLMAVLKPVNRLIAKLRKGLSNAFIKKEDSEQDERALLGQELLYRVEEAENDGDISEADSLLISNAIEFNDLRAEDILTPRVNIAGIPKDSTLERMADIFMESGYSRLPVYEESLDNIHGVVHIRDFLKCMADESRPLEEIIVPPVYTAPTARVRDLLGLLKKAKSHMAIVIDEYGGTEGLVTMEDILEQLVGEIYDESDEVIEEFVRLENGKIQIDCSADIEKLFEYFDMEEAEEESHRASTVGGWIMDTLGRIPEVGDSFVHEKLTVTVTQADQRRAEVCVVEVAEAVIAEEG